MRRLPITLSLIFLLLAACVQTDVVVSGADSTPTAGMLSTLMPVTQRQMNNVPEQPLATNTLRPVLAQNCPPPASGLTQHMAEAAIDYSARTASVTQTIRYTNRDSVSLTDLALVVEPTRYSGAFTLDSLQFTNAAQTEIVYMLEGNRLTLALTEPLGSGCSIELRAEYRLVIPPIGAGVDAYRGYFGYGSRQLNLSLWLLATAPRINGAWIAHDNIAVGEQAVFEVADWDVTLNVSGASDALVIAAPGTLLESGSGRWRYVLTGARDFALSMSESFVVTQEQTSTGVSVELYSYPDALFRDEQGALVDSAAHGLAVAARSLELYSELFGSFPYRRMVVVLGDFPDGMEFSGLVFVSGNWFYGFRGARSYLTIITAHEIAHQWWYLRVGNDQALDPWLDEALATYSELLFYEEFYPDSVGWWWEFRIDAYAPEGFVDSTVYEFPSIRAYINAVYLRGVRMLGDLRRDLGDAAFLAWLRRYAEIASGMIATPDVFWSLLTPEELELTRETRYLYLRNPEILQTVAVTPAP